MKSNMLPTTRALIVIATLNIIGVAGCSTFERIFERERRVPLEDVPSAVKAAAQAAVPGVILESAEIEETRVATVYELKGKGAGGTYEIQVDSEGRVREIEKPKD